MARTDGGDRSRDEQLRDLFERLLEKYENAQNAVIWEFSSDPKGDLQGLESDIADYRRRLDELLPPEEPNYGQD